MFNLLPEKYKRKLRREYKQKLGVVILTLFFFIQLIALAALFPSYVYSFLNNQELSEALVSLKITEAFQSGEIINEKVRDINWKSEVLTSWGHNVFSQDYVKKILDNQTEGISLRQIIFTTDSKDGFKITVSGEAATRENLISFSDQLRVLEDFSSVNVPVSDLAQRFNITFSLEVSGSFN